MTSVFIIAFCIASTDTIPFYEMDRVVVTATRIKTPLFWLPTNVELITENNIYECNVITVAEVIEKVLVDVSNRGTRGAERSARLREGGDASRHVLVMFDGQSLNDPFLGTADLDVIITDYIKSIEIVKGPISSLYGTNAFGGAINIITQKESTPKKTFLSISMGTFDTQKISLNSNFTIYNIDASLVINSEGSDGFRENSDYKGRDVFLSLLTSLKNLGSIRGKLLLHDSEFGVAGMNCTTIEEYNGESEKKAQFPDARQWRMKGFGEIEYTKGNFLNARISTTYSNIRYKCNSAYIDDNSIGKKYSGDLQINLLPGFIFGVDIQRNEFIKQSWEENTISKLTQNWAVFAQSILSKEPIRLISGIRYDHHLLFGGITNPRIVLIFRFSKNLKLSSTAGRAFRAPGIEDLYSPRSSWPASEWGPAGDTQGNPDLLPETGWGYDAGFEYESKKVIFGVSLFKNQIENLIKWADIDPNPNYEKWRPSNIGKSYNQGIEAKIKVKESFWGSHLLIYKFLESKGKKEDGSYKRLMYTSPYRLTYRISGKAFGVRFNGDISYTDEVKWEDDFDFPHRLPTYTVVNLSVGRKLKDIDFLLSVTNIFDNKYQTREYYPLPGREVYFKTVFPLFD